MQIFDIIIAVLLAVLIGFFGYKRKLDYKYWAFSTLLFPYLTAVMFIIVNYFYENKSHKIIRYAIAGELTLIAMGVGIRQLAQIFEGLVN